VKPKRGRSEMPLTREFKETVKAASDLIGTTGRSC
jgi:hypothetical protein